MIDPPEVGDVVRIKSLGVDARVVDVRETLGRCVVRVRQLGGIEFVSSHYLRELEQPQTAPGGRKKGG